MTHEAAEKHGAVNIEVFIRVKVSNFVPYERPACQILNNIPTKINQCEIREIGCKPKTRLASLLYLI